MALLAALVIGRVQGAARKLKQADPCKQHAFLAASQTFQPTSSRPCPALSVPPITVQRFAAGQGVLGDEQARRGT